MPRNSVSMGLKKVRGNHEVFCVQQELNTWNIDGSSVNKPGVGSWIKFWEQSTGRPRGQCAYSNCPKLAEHGGHVWITGGHSSMPREICWIVPICAECNSPLNNKRMQNSEGNHSRLRVGSLVVKTKYTFEMRTAQRRIAMDCTYENDSGYYTDDYEFMENDSFSNGSGGGGRRHSGGGQPYFRRRLCACGEDISFEHSQNPNFTRCGDCHNDHVGGGRRRSGAGQPYSPPRKCLDCPTNISNMPPSHTRCGDCHNNHVKRGRRRSVGGGPCFRQSEELVHNMANISSPSRSGSRWSRDEENQLKREIHSCRTLPEIARIHERTVGAIEERADRLELL